MTYKKGFIIGAIIGTMLSILHFLILPKTADTLLFVTGMIMNNAIGGSLILTIIQAFKRKSYLGPTGNGIFAGVALIVVIALIIKAGMPVPPP
ncbi:MAG: hypothetical protein ACREA3_02095 [Nitrosotalea sp.]